MDKRTPQAPPHNPHTDQATPHGRSPPHSHTHPTQLRCVASRGSCATAACGVAIPLSATRQDKNIGPH
eukprot:7378704-Prymnesium_polylepis.1